MKVRTDFIRLIAFGVSAVIAHRVHGENFNEYIVSDSPEPHQSVLVQSPDDLETLHSPMTMGGESFASAQIHDDFSAVSASQCCGTHGCNGSCRSSHAAEGWVNRLFSHCQEKCHSWTAQVDALMLWQGNIPSRPLLTSSPGGVLALDANQARTQMGAGPRFGLFYNLDPCHAIEGNYFWAEGFDGEATVPPGSYAPVTMPNPPVPSNVSEATLLTHGQFKSSELNWRWRNNEVLTWLLGFRWVEWNQAARLNGLNGQGQPFLVDGLTGNDLYGSQIGADLLFWDAGRRFRLNGIGKAGIYGNRAYQQASGTSNGVPQGPANGFGNQVSFFGEVGVYGDIAITRWLSWRTGYVVFWGTGMALPAENLSLVNFGPPASAQINITESLLVHGVTTGLEARW